MEMVELRLIGTAFGGGTRLFFGECQPRFVLEKRLQKTGCFVAAFLFITCCFFGLGKEAPDMIHRRGLDIFRSGNYRQSIDYYLHQLNDYPDDESMMNYLAISYTGLGMMKEAETVYITMLKYNPQNKNARAGLFTLYQILINRASAVKNYNLAFDYVKKGEYYLPDNSNFYVIDAGLNLDLANYYEAAAMYKKSWEIDHEKTDNIINIWKLRKAGEAYYHLGKEFTGSWRDYVNGVLRLDPDNKELLNLMAEAYFFNNESPQKRNKLRNRAMELYMKENPNRPNITVAFPVRGRFQLASGYFEWALDTHNGYDGYCLDIVMIDENGGKLKKGPTNGGLDVILSFGQDIYAALDGVVEKAVDTNIDNPIGVQNYFAPNFVKIRHEQNGLIFYTVYYHIKKGSLTVKTGQRIKAGEKIAQIGNSGYSFGPHLHFGVYDGNNVSLPIHFTGVSVEGHPDIRGDFKYKNGMILRSTVNEAEQSDQTE